MHTIPDDQSSFDLSCFIEHLRIKGLDAELPAEDAIRLIAQHFRQRTGPRWCFYMHGSSWIGLDGRVDCRKAATHYAQGKYTNAWAPFQTVPLKTDNKWDWTSGFELFRNSLARHSFVPELSTAFAMTGKRRFLRLCYEMIADFNKCMPFRLDPRFHDDHDSYFGDHPVHNTLAVVRRCMRWLDFMHSGALHIPGLISDEELVDLLRVICFHALQYTRLIGDEMRVDNHHLIDHGYANYLFGLMFPEFEFATAAKKYGEKCIHYHIRKNLFDDGCYAEHSIKYQYHITFSLLFPLAVAEANGEKLLTTKEKLKMQRWLGFFAHATSPQGTLSGIGDEYGGRMNYLFETLAPALKDPAITTMAANLGYKVNTLTSYSLADVGTLAKHWQARSPNLHGLTDFWMKKLKPSTDKNKARRRVKSDNKVELQCMGVYPQGGFSFMRNSWNADSDYLAISHYSDSMIHGHTHWDPMSFLISSQGESLIADPATLLYQQKRELGPDAFKKYRGYSYSFQAHNCLSVNSNYLKNIEALGHDCHWGGEPPRHKLGIQSSSKYFQVLEAYHDGFAPIRHRRFFIQLRGFGFCMIDIMNEGCSEGVRPHEYEQFIHADIAVKLQLQKQGHPSFLLKGKRASVRVIPGSASEYTLRRSQDSWLDDLTLKNRVLKKGPGIGHIHRRIRGAAVFSTFYATGEHAAVKVPNLITCLNAEAAAYMGFQAEGSSIHEIRLLNGNSFLIAAAPFEKNIEHADINSDADLVIVARNKRGKVIDWGMARGRKIQSHDLSVQKRISSNWEQMP